MAPLRLLPVCLAVLSTPCLALQSFFPKLNLPRNDARASAAEGELLAAIKDSKRLANSDRIVSLIDQLEGSSSSIREPSISPQIYGRWRLIFTSAASTASPIQKKAVDSEAFLIFQDIVVEENQLLVKQIVQFSDTVELSVDALASTTAYPLAELTAREGTGKVLGLNLLGVSLVGEQAEEDPNRPNSRISFVFDEGKFIFGSGFTLPYPVPFRLPFFRDFVKGWIDVTYLSSKVRISRGNKGTTFVLVKEEQ
jgi:hypothetical protein